jgi:inhibitor of cysteine peptidase
VFIAKNDGGYMHPRYLLLTLATCALMLITSACAEEATAVPTPTSQPTQTPRPQPVSLAGPDCPKTFREEEQQQITRETELTVNSTLTLTLGSTPSIPCSWESPEIGDDAVVRQVDHQSKWPAEGATPQPGAPGTEIWAFEALEAGECTISLDCMCLGEQGAETERTGTFTVKLIVTE